MRRRRHHTRRHHRNPPRRRGGFRLGGGFIRQIQGTLPDVGYGLVGFFGESYVPVFASRFLPLPDKSSNALGYYAVKGASGLATAWAVSRFIGQRQGRAALVGALLGLVSEPINEFLVPMILSSGAAAPAAAGMGYLSPGATVSAYLPGMAAYLPQEGLGDDDDELGYEQQNIPSRLDPGERGL